MSLDQELGFLGLFVGGLGGIFGLWWGRKKAAQNRGLDERHENISIKSLAIAWKITLLSIYLLFILFTFGIHLASAPVLGIILLVHMGGWAVSTVYYHLKL